MNGFNFFGGGGLDRFADRKTKTLFWWIIGLLIGDLVLGTVLNSGIAKSLLITAVRAAYTAILWYGLSDLRKRNAEIANLVTENEIRYLLLAMTLLTVLKTAQLWLPLYSPATQTAKVVYSVTAAAVLTLVVIAACVLAIMANTGFGLRMVRIGSGDELNVFLLSAAFAMFAVSHLVTVWFPVAAGESYANLLALESFLSLVPTLGGFGLIAWSIFRLLSKNRFKRNEENNRYLVIDRKVGGFLRLQKNKIRDYDTFVYKKCPSCSAVLRLPRKKGKHTVVCPRCTNRFEVVIDWEKE